MLYTDNYNFNLPQLLDAAFIVKYNENIVEIDGLLKEWKDLIDVQISNVTEDMVKDINDDIDQLEYKINRNINSNDMLKTNINELYNIVNNENDFLMNYFELRFINIESDIETLNTNYNSITEEYNQRIIEISNTEDIVDDLILENETFQEDLNTIDSDITTLTQDNSINENKLEILRSKLIGFINENSDLNLPLNESFNNVLDHFFVIYREVQ